MVGKGGVRGHPQNGCQYRGTPSRMAASIGYEPGVSFPLHASPFTTIKCQAADWGSEMFLGSLSPQIYNPFLRGHLSGDRQMCLTLRKRCFLSGYAQLQIQ